MVWLKWLSVVLLLLAAVAVLYGSRRWDASTKVILARLEVGRLSPEPAQFDAREIEGLPAPVKRYFQNVLTDGQPLIAAVWVNHVGTFNMSEKAEQWKPFASKQRVITARPGFDWDARIRMLPGVSVHVHDAYVAGAGILRGAILGLVPVVEMADSPALARGELMRFFAEAAWYPTALLPSQGVHWAAVDDRSAQATLIDSGLSLTLLFRFGADGLIDTVHAQARERIVDGQTVSTPWEGRYWNYTQRDGMRVPLNGEVAWLLPEGAKPYWRGQITSVNYEFAR